MTAKQLFDHGYRRINPDTACRVAKQTFVDDYLAPCLRRSVPDFHAAEYALFAKDDWRKEYVIITHNSGEYDYINVTADSNLGILVDVGKFFQ